jgi:RNA polymerase sigma factor (sigma-70 family)
MEVVGTAARPTGAASDTQLVRAAREDDHAFEELYRRYHGPVAGYVRRYVRDSGRAEEVAQETFVAALSHIRQTDSEIQFKPWIYRIARNAAIDHHRRNGRAEELSFESGSALGLDPLVLAAPTTPEASVIDRERFEHFRGALEELSETQHRIIVLRELEGLSYREIGESMQLSSAAVESALFRARRKLQDEYEQLDSGRRCTVLRGAMARLADGSDSVNDGSRLDRHARRCWACRRRARELGLKPAAVARRAGALLPLPAFLRRLFHGADAASAGAREAARLSSAPVFETVTQGAQKAAIVVASAIAIGGGGATLGGVGPLAIGSDHTPSHQAPQRGASSSGTAARTSPGTRSAGVPAGARSRRAGPVRTPRGGRHRHVRGPLSPHAPAAAPSPAGPLQAPVPPHGSLPHKALGSPTPALKVPKLPEPAVPEVALPPAPQLPALPDLPVGGGLSTQQVQAVLPNPSMVTDGLGGAPPPR